MSFQTSLVAKNCRLQQWEVQIKDCQNRYLDEVYPILYIDSIHYSVRDNGVIRKFAAYVILEINAEGKKEVVLSKVS